MNGSNLVIKFGKLIKFYIINLNIYFVYNTVFTLIYIPHISNNFIYLS